MAWVSFIPLIASVAMNAMNSGGGPTPGQAGQYSPTGLGSADYRFQSTLGNLDNQVSGISSNIDPVLMASLNNMLGINYGGYVGAGNKAGQQYGNLADTYGNYGKQLGDQAQNLYGASQQLYQNGFDPQKQLYDQQYQKTIDSSNAVNSMYGLGSSAYGAGIVGQDLNNFNMNWQNNQLGRQLQAASGMNSLNQSAGADLTGSATFYGQQPGATLNAAQTPITAQQYAYGQPAQAATQYATNMGSSMGPETQFLSSIIPYLNYGNGAGSNMYASLLSGANFNANQQAGVTQGLTTAFSNPGTQSWLKGLFSSGSSGDFGGMNGWAGGGGESFGGGDFSGTMMA